MGQPAAGAVGAKSRKIPILYESILEGADNPSVVRGEGLGTLKLALYKTYSAILAISPALADDFLANGFRQEQVFTLTNPVDTLRFHPAASPAEKQHLRSKLVCQRIKPSCFSSAA